MYMAHAVLTPSLILDSSYQQRDDLVVPTPEMLALPEKVLQFGTGGFLRAFADYFIDSANRKGLFGGRVVIVGSTGSRRTQWINDQGGLYTLRIQGLKDGQAVEEYRVIGSVSRALAAKTEWPQVVACAQNPHLEIIISNTTEVGVVYDPDDRYEDGSPASFPGKLTAVLYERARHFGFSEDKGVTVLPCELITENGNTLKSIVLRLAEDWALGDDFVDWLTRSVHFCNTLVDRIVPGIPDGPALEDIYERLGYKDALLTNAEVYRLWPISGSHEAFDRLTFAPADPGVVLTDDVHPFKERKVRILNGTHTSCVPLSFLAGIDTVLSMMHHDQAGECVRGVMMDEIVPSLDVPGGEEFAREVIDRFSNPYLRHRLIDITLQSTSKLRLRVIPTLLRFYEKYQALPRRICAGFAAYLVFMRGTMERDGVIYGSWNESLYPIRDDQAAFYLEAWKTVDDTDRESIQRFVHRISEHQDFWGESLSSLPGFSELVADYCWMILQEGATAVLEQLAQES